MKFKFNKEVRQSLAGEIKKVSTVGGLGLGVFGFTANSPYILIAACSWWAVCQLIAHVLMSISDEE